MDRKKRIYIQYAIIFILIMVFGITTFLMKTADVWTGSEIEQFIRRYSGGTANFLTRKDDSKRRNLSNYKYETISPKEFMNFMNQKTELIIIDTRIKEDFNKGHIRGAINLSYINLKKMNKVLEKEKDKEIFVYSEDGERAKTICEILSSLGFSKIRNIDGGITGWINSGGEVVK
ncbi:MAG: rhodanese-like domain-containing protein [Nitrospirota bacterium]